MENNPLRQFFRRPAVYLTLPSKGAMYADGVIDPTETGELPVYPMTAIDEITVRTPDALFNGTAVAELIKSCIPNIKDPWKIASIDLDAILIAIKAASGGEEYEIESKCPSCEEISNYNINLVGILTTLKPGDYSKELEIGELKFKFRPLTYKEMTEASNGQFEVQKTFSMLANVEDPIEQEKISYEALKKVTFLTMDIVAKTIEYIEMPGMRVTEYEHILDYLQNCGSTTYTGIRDYNSSLRQETELKPLEIKCGNCEHEYKQEFTLNPADFFG